MEIKSELLYPYAEEERANFIVIQNHQLGYEIRYVSRTVEYEEEIFEFEEVEEQVPIYDEETGEIIGYETIIVEKPIMITVEEEIEVPIYDEETGEIIGYETKTIEKEVQKSHFETREKEVTDLQAWGYTDEEKQEQEIERINNLTLARDDVFSALIQARMINEASLKEMIEAEMPETTDEEKKKKMLALNALENASNFHRGHDLVNEIGAELNISQENLNLFFETNDYHYLEVETNPTEI